LQKGSVARKLRAFAGAACVAIRIQEDEVACAIFDALQELTRILGEEADDVCETGTRESCRSKRSLRISEL
jgi:hypothetical protein